MQGGSSSVCSRMPQTIAIVIARFVCSVLENFTKRFIRLVLEKFALAGNPAEQVMGDQLLLRAALICERPLQMAEQAMPAKDFLFIDKGGL